MSLVEILQKTELFQGLSDQTLGAVAALASRQSFEDGDVVYDLGDDSKDIYVIESGRVRFSIGVGNRPDGAGSVMTEGSVFGWAAVLEEDHRRVASASCLDDTVMHVIPGRDLLALFDREHEAGYLFMRRLATMIARDFISALSV